eukprot:CAMPEP_0202457870 /NCGR_PEP_ID=MMETSP1360-20130828/16442_1 /ASSEMBLY_ACC=CAM_ASM_000848 /TAXON_ID=515479 /ORGANISM="Licmophora paradoxa, Strain CCMP2313" /LENGTH=149 /DNA_ID=CAMNT_0049078063 /DNA_START=48 /DNA_END=497 /DNA_ORIENTATION=+
MKLSVLLALATATTSVAFTSPTAFTRSSALFMSNEKSDSSAAVAAAMEASEKYGATSPEARVAWDIVEEMDASNSHVAKTETPVVEETKVEKEAPPQETFVVSNRDEALAEAKKITEEKGITSPEARVAWELVEELAATESHHNNMGSG